MPQRYKNIKVFISSTFRDLDKERGYIVTHVFNRLRGEYRDLPIHEIDLRWGLTDKDVEEGRIIDSCLYYIHQAKPFFIGILGDRYGSTFSPESVSLSPSSLRHFSDINKDINDNLSVTEIEILNGAIRNPDAHAIFFIKKNATPFPGETAEQWEKLERLKAMIRAQKHHEVVEYETLEDFDKIIPFIKKHIGEPSLYNIPFEGKDRADKIFSLHYEKSLEYVKRVPYDKRLDRLLGMIDEKVNTGMTAFIGTPGGGKSTTLAYMAHHFTGDRIYVPIYGDAEVLPSTSGEFAQFLLNSIKEYALRTRRRKGLFKFVYNWFRDGLKEIDYTSADTLFKEIGRYKWCFILDNIEACEMDYRTPESVYSYNKLLNLRVSISHYLEYISNVTKTKVDYRFITCRSLHREDFDRCITWRDKSQIIDLDKTWWFDINGYIRSFMKDYSKRLTQTQGETMFKSPVRWIPRQMILSTRYMAEYVSFERLDNFILNFSKANSYFYGETLYIRHAIYEYGEPMVKHLFMILLIFREGVPFQTMLGWLGIKSSFRLHGLLRILDSLVYNNSAGVALRNPLMKPLICRAANLSDTEIREFASSHFSRMKDRVDLSTKLKEFSEKVSSDFAACAHYLDFLMPNEIKSRIENLKAGIRSRNSTIMSIRIQTARLSSGIFEATINKKRDEINELQNTLKGIREKYWLSEKHLTPEAVAHAYVKATADYSSDWHVDEFALRAYLEACLGAQKIDEVRWMMFHPVCIKFLSGCSAFILLYTKELKDGGSWAIPRPLVFPKEAFDIKRLTYALNDLVLQNFQKQPHNLNLFANYTS